MDSSQMEKRFAALEAELQGEKRKRQAETNALQAETKALREGLAKEEKAREDLGGLTVSLIEPVALYGWAQLCSTHVDQGAAISSLAPTAKQ